MKSEYYIESDKDDPLGHIWQRVGKRWYCLYFRAAHSVNWQFTEVDWAEQPFGPWEDYAEQHKKRFRRLTYEELFAELL